jgi:hypothetical protein
MKNILKLFSSIILITAFVSCSNEDLDPVLALDKDTETGIQTADDLFSVLNSAYNRMTPSGYYGRDMIIMGDVRTDNLYSNMNSGRFQDSNMDHNPDGYGPWTTIYGAIAITNIVIGADLSKIDGSSARLNHIVGQAYALRALLHFDLLRSYGQHFISGQGGANALGIPYVKTYKDAANLSPARDTVASNIGDIESDLGSAFSLMSQSFDTSTSYMTIAGAYAIAARVALYVGYFDSDYYEDAGKYAKWVIDNSGAVPANASNFAATYYTDNASNSLFELAYSGTDSASINGLGYILRGTSYGDVRILTGGGAPDLYDIFEADKATDVRFTVNGMIGISEGLPTVIGKYPSVNGSDNITLFRVEEMHLIYAEAMLRAGDATTALTYLNNIPSLRNATLYTEATIENILNERRKEFYAEGLRFYDLARNGMDMPLVDSIKQLNDDLDGTPPKFGSYRYAYPIAKAERDANPNIVQNYGY